MIVIIDFDGTIADTDYPRLGPLRKNVVKVIQQIQMDGCKILIDTCRTGQFEGEAVKFLIDNGIPFDFVNCNLPSQIEFYGMDCRKLSGDVRIDDTNLGGIPDDWEDIYKILVKHPKYPVKTSADWAAQTTNFKIINPDGWPRGDKYDYAWNEELISATEFYRRAMMSTLSVDVEKVIKINKLMPEL